MNISFTNYPNKLEFVTNPQICSDFRLDQTADEDMDMVVGKKYQEH
ncbi:MAG TPA: hypothetical protein PLE30_03500 [Candidatus Kapabacteria bacterium]|nr:hypothetical protein [Candidatus Kapabacteria bacterium]